MVSYFQGDIVLVDFPHTDGLKSDKRPAIIISNSAINNFNEVIMAAITSTIRNDAFSFKLDNTYLTQPLGMSSEIRCHIIFTFKTKQIIKKLSVLNHDKRKELFQRISSLLSTPQYLEHK